MSEILSESSNMSSVAEASALLRRVAGPREAGDSVKLLIRRASKRLKWSFTRTKDVWYRDARRIDSIEMDRLRDKVAELEARQAIASVVALRQRLAEADEDFHGPTIAALDDALRRMGADVRALAVREEEQRSVMLNGNA